MKIIFILTFVFILLEMQSCKNSSSGAPQTPLLRGNELIEFNDSKIDSVINEYVKKHEVDPSQRVLALNVYRDPIRSIYFLTQVRRKESIKSNPPDYFFVHNKRFLVLIQLGGHKLFKSNDIIPRVDSTLQRLGIELANDSLDYDPPVWQFVNTCDDKLLFKKKSDFIQNFLPCGYEVKQDSLQMNNFSLRRQ